MSIVVEFKERSSNSGQHQLTHYCDKKCPERKLWCHKVDPTERGNYFGSWKTSHAKSERSLFGPASFLKSKKIYYPCNLSGCFVGCACLSCHGRSPVVKDDTKEQFDDHQLYHHTRHMNCIFCSAIFKAIPHYNYSSIVLEGTLVERYYVPCQSFIFHHYYVLVKLSIEEQVRCDECDLTFTTKNNKYRHVRAKHIKKNYECKDCDKKFNRVDALERHKEVHEDPIVRECSD